MANTIGNLSTIIKIISMWIAGWFIGLLISQGLNLPISEAQLSEVISAIIFLALGYVDAKYPNTFKFFGNEPAPLETEEKVLNDEYECDEDGC